MHLPTATTTTTTVDDGLFAMSVCSRVRKTASLFDGKRGCLVNWEEGKRGGERIGTGDGADEALPGEDVKIDRRE